MEKFQSILSLRMIAALKSDCFLVSQESNVIGYCNNTSPLSSDNAEARTTHKRAALRRLHIFLGIVCTQARKIGFGYDKNLSKLAYLLVLSKAV